MGGLLLSLLWPYNPIFSQVAGVAASSRSGLVNLGGNASSLAFLHPYTLLFALGPAWAGFVFCFLAPRQWRRQLAVSAAVYSLLWIGGTIGGLPLAHRFVYFLVFVLHLAIATSLSAAVHSWLSRRRRLDAAFAPATVWVVAALLWPWAAYNVGGVAKMVWDRIDFETMSIRPSYAERQETDAKALEKVLSSPSRLLADRRAAIVLPALGLPVVPGGGLNVADADTVDAEFVHGVGSAAAQSGATHLLLRRAADEAMTGQELTAMESLGSLVLRTEDYALIELTASGGSSR
jgi:hypothetical protein